jgi:hypothetical protein
MRWLFRTARLTVSDDIPAPPDRVRDFYVDLENIRLVHPLVVAVETTARTETSDGYVQEYLVRDRIPFGPFTLGIRYVARLQVPAEGDVITEAHQFPKVRLNSVVSFEPVEGGTRLLEDIRVRAPRLLAAVTIREAEQAHIKMLSNIRRHFA